MKSSTTTAAAKVFGTMEEKDDNGIHTILVIMGSDTYIYSYIHMLIHTYAHTYICSYIHILIHTYANTYRIKYKVKRMSFLLFRS